MVNNLANDKNDPVWSACWVHRIVSNLESDWTMYTTTNKIEHDIKTVVANKD